MKPRITFMDWGSEYPSARLRAQIPQRELAALGVEKGRDILVISKHGWEWDEMTRGFKKVVFDVCDSHWRDEYAQHYLDACARADAVTCNTRTMAEEIKKHTGRDAWVIPDPYEAPEGRARLSDKLLWFGHSWNLDDLLPWLDELAGRPLTIVTNNPVAATDSNVRLVQWSPEAMNAEFARAGLVIIPTGRSMAKSGNRAIESIRRGLFPVCGYLPAYSDLGVWIGRIDAGVEWALSHHDEVVRRVRDAQGYVRYEYSPARIAKLWLEALSYV